MTHEHLPASAWVEKFSPMIPKNFGPVLDLACGSGRHTRLLLDAGYEVYALDKQADLLKPLKALGATCVEFDLETNSGWPFDAGMFAGVIVTNYLHRPLFKHLRNSLKAQGVLIYETFSAGNEQYGRPKNPDFLLHRNELLEQLVFTATDQATVPNSMQCIAFEDVLTQQPNPARLQRICIQLNQI